MKRRKTLNRAASSSSDEPGLGRWTCYHGEEGEEKPWLPPADKSSESIREYVAEAARRLPLEEIPELVYCVGAVGYCFGLADPVTNIILNAVAHLAAGGAEDLPPPPPPKKRTRRTDSRGWGYISLNSFCGLLAFMKVYFRYLTDSQARHYLYLGSYDLLLAVELVHHDRRRLPRRRPSLLPDDGRMKTALRIAAVQADHPAPDELVQTMTVQYPSHLLSPIMDKLQGSELITADDVRAISDMILARHCLPPNMDLLCCPNGDACAHQATNNGDTLQVVTCIGGGAFARISTEIVTPNHVEPLRYISDMAFDDSSAMEMKLSKCSSGGCQVNYLDFSSPCEYILSLKMCLLDAIHGFYIRALAVLPLPRADDGDDDSMRRGRLLRALIVSGHCYGPMDPVSNIILNAVLYDAMYEGDGEVELPHDIFDTHAMRDMASCSLDGLVALLCDITAAATGDPLSKHEAVEYLWSRQCDLSEKLQQTVMMTKKKNPYAAAARASKHPQHAMLASLLVSFSGEKLDRLRYLLRSISDGSGCVISSDDWEQLNTVIKKELTAMIARKEELPFDPLALSASSRVSAYVNLQSLARSKLEELLLRYSRQHPWEPRYKLDLICGVEEPRSPRCRCYHANFLASATHGSVLKFNGETTTAPTTVRKLFFAEFWDSQTGRFYESHAKPICCPVQDSSPCFGRCIFCGEASTIVHPPCAARSHLDDDDDYAPILDYDVKGAIRMWFPNESQYEEMKRSTARGITKQKG